MKDGDFLRENVAIAAFFGCAIGGLFMMILQSGLSDNLIRYGTFLLTTLATFCAAGMSLFGVHKSIESAKKAENDRRLADLKAARAVLPLALARMSAVVENSINRCCEPADFDESAANAALVSDEMKVDADIVAIFRDCIKASDDNSGE